MPIQTFKSIVYVSSEDPNFPATNLLRNVVKKWKSKTTGESTVSVILALEKPVKITGIDIGNENSAFIGVHVNRTGAPDNNYQEILLTSSFMTPLESQNSQTSNRVRCFSESVLVKETADQKWDLIKVICTQPYNKHVQYGISFIKIYGFSDSDEKNKPSNIKPETKLLFGKFKLREESPESSESDNLLFTRWKQQTKCDSIIKNTIASEIRNASMDESLLNSKNLIKQKKIVNKNTSFNVDNDSENKTKRNQHYDKLLYDADDEKPNEKLDKMIEAEKLKKEKEKNIKLKNSPKKLDNLNSSSTESSSKKTKRPASPDKNKKSPKKLKEQPTKKKESNEPQKIKINPVPPNTYPKPSTSSTHSQINENLVKSPKNLKKYKKFSKLLEGVVLVISGIQNPERGILRQKALEMGAKYRPDWDSNCTHLICAFKGTPKYNQVHGKGKIISKLWITDSHLKHIKLPWRRYALDPNDKNQPESEDEIFDEEFKPKEKNSTPQKDIKNKDDDIIIYDQSESSAADEDDTDDEIQQALNKIPKEKSDFDKSTDEDDQEKDENKKEKNLKFFNHCKFYLNEDLHTVDVIKLKAFIKQYGGELIKHPVDANFIISKEKVTNLKDFNGEILKPLWIYECNDMECLLPTDRYVIN